MVDVLADGLWAYRLGKASFALIFPVAGALLLGVGLYRRRASRRWHRRDNARLLDPPNAADRDDEVDDGGPYDEFDGQDEDLPPRLSQPPGRGTVLIILGTVLLVLGAGHVFSALVAARTTRAIGNVGVGQCITAQAYDEGRMNSEPVDCRRSDATMELVSHGDGRASCPDGSRNSPRYPALTNEVRTQCFALNLRENHCYAIIGTVAPVNCIDPTATVKVSRRLDGTGEAVGCPAEARVVSYPEPPRVYCFVAP